MKFVVQGEWWVPHDQICKFDYIPAFNDIGKVEATKS